MHSFDKKQDLQITLVATLSQSLLCLLDILRITRIAHSNLQQTLCLVRVVLQVDHVLHDCVQGVDAESNDSDHRTLPWSEKREITHWIRRNTFLSNILPTGPNTRYRYMIAY